MNKHKLSSKKVITSDPNTDDSIQPNFKVHWLNKSTKEKGNSTFFTYEYGAEIIKTVFETMYPEREILNIIEFGLDGSLE